MQRLEAALGPALAFDPPDRDGLGEALQPLRAEIAQLEQPPTRRRVAWLITTLPGAASACSRAARFGVSPTTASSCAAPSPIRSPTTTRPVAMPTRAASGSPAGGSAGRPPRPGEPGPDRPLGLVLVRPRPAEIGEHAVAHVLGDVAAERSILGAGVLIGADHVRACPRDRAGPRARSSRPGRRTAPSAAAARLRGSSVAARSARRRRGAACRLAARAAIALSSFLRWPSGTPSFSRSASVSSGSTSIDRVGLGTPARTAPAPFPQPGRDVHRCPSRVVSRGKAAVRSAATVPSRPPSPMMLGPVRRASTAGVHDQPIEPPMAGPLAA